MGVHMKKSKRRRFFLNSFQGSKDLLSNNNFLERAKSSPNCFTRHRKMGFVSIFEFLLHLPRGPLPAELNNFCGDKMKITKQAFSKSRNNIKSEAFREFAHVSSATVMSETKDCGDIRGYRAFSVDGTELEIPPTPENISYFGTHGGPTACRARVSALLNISEGIIADAEITPLSTDERTLANHHIEYLKKYLGQRDLMIFDRGYPSKDLINTLESSHIKYLMRAQKSLAKEIDETPENDFNFIWTYKENHLNIRVVRVVLETGEVENLITNLPKEEFETEHFKELYFMRWGIESKYNTLKNKLLVEHFSGKTRLAIEQDFYATIWVANMLALAKGAADEQIAEENAGKKLKHRYQANEKLAIKKFRDRLIQLMAEDDLKVRESLFDLLVIDIARDRSLIRPGRHFPRPNDSHHRRKHRIKYVL